MATGKIYPILLIVMLFFTAIFPQESADSDTYNKKVLPRGMTKTKYEKEKIKASSPFDQTNPLKMLFVILIRSYQVIFSSQDGSTCQFRPSCSHFGAKAIKEHGPIQGLFMTSDRLLRCNPFTYGLYPLTKDGLHHMDPLDEHLLWEKEKK
jgi:putative membrane protein insertion efficiency factor